jgi:hypothetical protein
MKKIAAKKVAKKKDLTASERLKLAIKSGKILSSPLLEGDTEVRDEKVYAARKHFANGYMQVGVSQGVTFSEDLASTRMTNWHRIDTWVVAQVQPDHIEECHGILFDYVVDKLADKYEAIMDAVESED